MSLNLTEFYNLPAIVTTYAIQRFNTPHFTPFPELNNQAVFNQKSLTNFNELNNKVSVRVVHIHPYSFEEYQDRENWLLASMWYETNPFMVMRNTFHQGDHYPNRFVTSLNWYQHALYFLHSLMEIDVIDPHEKWEQISGTLIDYSNCRTVEETNEAYISKAINQTILYPP